MSEEKKMNHVTIYTDGAAEPNPGPGGYGVVLIAGKHRKELSGGFERTTNNRMELTAVIQALEALKKSSAVVVYTDSEYVRKGITEWLRAWKARDWRTADKKPVKNQDLWERLDAEAQRHEVTWLWVKGHAGNEGNERVDRLANAAIDEMLALDSP